MKSKYNIGDNVFIIKDNKIKEKEIKVIQRDNDNNVKYMFDLNTCGGMKESEIFKTKLLAQKTYAQKLQNAKFKKGDIVLVLREPYMNNTRGFDEWDIEKIEIIKEPYLNSINSEIIYIMINDSEWGYNRTESNLININKESLKDEFDILELIEEHEEVQTKLDNIETQIRKKYYKVESKYKRKFVERHNTKDNRFFPKELHKNLFGEIDK